jgi:hypothetical protein
MLIIKFWWNRELDVVRDDTGIFAVNSDGLIVMQPQERTLPSPDAFLGAVKLMGFASIKTKKMMYKFSDITPEFLASEIYGLSSIQCTMPQFTIVVNELGNNTLWSRGIERIYFSKKEF